MESLKAQLMVRLQEILSDAKMASHLVEDGKEVRADRQLQGVRTKLVQLIQWTHVALPEMEENVAQETPETK